MIRYLFLLVMCLACIQAFGNEGMSGKVISVVDGNTIEVLGEDKQTHVVALAGIDSPELTQKYGEEAKAYLEKVLVNKEVIVRFEGKDRKGNQLAVVLLRGKVDLRIALLKEGLAWTSEKNPLPELEAHRIKAQQKGKGLWKEQNPTPPWTYRRQQSMLQPKSS